MWTMLARPMQMLSALGARRQSPKDCAVPIVEDTGRADRQLGSVEGNERRLVHLVPSYTYVLSDRVASPSHAWCLGLRQCPEGGM